MQIFIPTGFFQCLSLSLVLPLINGGLEDWNNGILVIGDDKDASELVKQRLQMWTPHVLIVHDLFQVMVSPEIVKQPGSRRQQSHVRGVETEMFTN